MGIARGAASAIPLPEGDCPVPEPAQAEGLAFTQPDGSTRSKTSDDRGEAGSFPAGGAGCDE